MDSEILNSFAKLIGELNGDNIEKKKSSLSNLLDQVVHEQQKGSVIRDNFSILDDVFTQKPVKNIKFKKSINDLKGKVLIVMGKPTVTQDTGKKKIPFFCLSYYTPLSVDEDIRDPIASFEESLENTYPTSKKFLVIHPEIPYVKSKGKFVYKTINSVVETGKRLYGLEKHLKVKENKSAVINFNNLLDVFDDRVNVLCKTVNLCN